MLVALALLTILAFLVFYGLFAALDLLTQSLRCPHPMPDDLPWNRCAGPCAWCDYMERWAHEPRGDGPYRVDGRRPRSTL